jgi:predicted KAP-like P-loop ATPase
MFLNDNETVVDLIRYEPIARSIVALLEDTAGSPITIGVHGDWGAGKSSVLAMVEKFLSTNPKTLCLRFNGWTFQGFDDAKLVMLETIVTEIRTKRSTMTKVNEHVARLLRRIDWLKVAKHAGGLGLSVATGMPMPEHIAAIVKFVRSVASSPGEAVSKGVPDALLAEAKSLVKDAPGTEKTNVPTEIQSFREDFHALLHEAEVDRLVVLVDDLDRCLPQTIIETLEAIRLFLFVENTAFVIAVDEAMVEYAVRRHFPDLPGGMAAGGYARNYLEKLIQVPFRIPALGPAETRTYIALLFLQRQLSENDFAPYLEVAKTLLGKPWITAGLDRHAVESVKAGAPAVVDEALTLASQLSQLLTEGTNGNPRQAKRFLNTLLLREAIAAARGFKSAIERPVLAKIMLLERFCPTQYNELVKLVAASANGVVAELDQLEKIASQAKADAGKEPSPTMAVWLKEEAAREWLKRDPKIGLLDLRPYMFVTRDKRALSGAVLSLGHLEPLLERLSAGDFAAARESETVSRLSPPEARALFNALRDQMLAPDTLKTRPAEAAGLVIIGKHHHALQVPLVEALRAREPKNLGAWAVSGWDDALSTPDAQNAFKKLVAEWSTQSDNKPLQTAAKGKLKTMG